MRQLFRAALFMAAFAMSVNSANAATLARDDTGAQQLSDQYPAKLDARLSSASIAMEDHTFDAEMAGPYPSRTTSPHAFKSIGAFFPVTNQARPGHTNVQFDPEVSPANSPWFSQWSQASAYSTAKWPPIPRQSGHRFHVNLATDSTPIRPPIPRESGHRFHGNPATILWPGRKDMN